MKRQKRSRQLRRHRSRLETLERRNLLAGDVGHNFVEAEDVNLDGEVSPIDALNVINELGRRNREGGSGDGGRWQMLADVDANGELTPKDALWIINRISQGRRSAAELEEGADRLAHAILSEELPGFIAQDTAERWLQKVEDRTGAKPDRRGAFNRLDANDDGLIDSGEVRDEIWQRLSGADTDGDGAVSKEELRAARPSEDRVGRPGSRAAAAFGKLDADKNGALTEDEVSQRGWSRLSQADADADGAVTRREIVASRAEREAGVQRPEPGQRFAELDLNDDGRLSVDEVSENAWAKISEADSNDDGGVTLEELVALRAAREDGVQRPEPGQRFASLDLNQDEQLTADEVSEEVWSKISQADANGDDAVTLAELQGLREVSESNLSGPANKLSLTLFNRLDVNDDGAISNDEVSRLAWQVLSQADANDDDLVTFAEIRQHRIRGPVGPSGSGPSGPGEGGPTSPQG